MFRTSLVLVTVGLAACLLAQPFLHVRNITDRTVVGEGALQRSYQIYGSSKTVETAGLTSTTVTKKVGSALVTEAKTQFMRPPLILVRTRSPTEEEATVWRNHFGRP